LRCLLTDDAVIFVVGNEVATNLSLRIHHQNALRVEAYVISSDLAPSGMNQDDSGSRTVTDNILDDGRVMRVLAAQRNVTLSIVGDLVALDDCIGPFYNQDALFVVFVDFVQHYQREGLFAHLDACFPIKCDQVILTYF
jgi:hypothetical protein